MLRQAFLSASQPSPPSASADFVDKKQKQISMHYSFDYPVLEVIKLERAAEIKRSSVQVVDSIVAQDISRFPDPTTAAALQRVPGVQVQNDRNNELAGVRIRGLTDILWKRKLDPDMYALPIHSALVDLIGQLLLVLCFEIVSHLGVHLKASTP